MEDIGVKGVHVLELRFYDVYVAHLLRSWNVGYHGTEYRYQFRARPKFGGNRPAKSKVFDHVMHPPSFSQAVQT